MDIKLEGIEVDLRILIPLISSDVETEIITPAIRTAYNSIYNEYSNKNQNCNCEINYKLGCMLETPKSCISAHKLAMDKNFDFLLIATNELTQLKLGYDRTEFEKVNIFFN